MRILSFITRAKLRTSHYRLPEADKIKEGSVRFDALPSRVETAQHWDCFIGKVA